MDIRTYLVQAADALTERAPSLPEDGDWARWLSERRRLFWRMLGIDRYMAAARPPLNVEVTRVHRRDGYRIECLSYESLPGLRVEANLYVPDGPGPHPGMLYVCGHTELQKASHYQLHARQYARLGFVTLIIDTVQYGEVRGYHHGTHRYGWFHWISRGYTPAGVETWNGIRGLDLLCSLPEVDATRLGVTGTSGGGAMTWWITAADVRVKAASPSCGTATVASHVRARTVDGHCDCMFPVNLYGWSLVDMAALAAPRPVLIVSADRDVLFTAEGIADFYRRLRRVYGAMGCAANLELFTFRAPHSYQPESRRRTFSWFLRHLHGRDVPPEAVEDVDGHAEEPSALNVYVRGLPPNNRATTVHDWFVPKAAPPVIRGRDDLERERDRVAGLLRATAFHAFPASPPAARPDVTQEWLDDGWGYHAAFTYASDGGWRLEGAYAVPKDGAPDSPAVVHLLHPGAAHWTPHDTLPYGLPGRWPAAVLATRGTGPFSWSPGLQWHVRRAAALTGRTVASMRVYDALQGLRALRTFDPFQERAVYLMGEGEMAVVALYAALLDPEIRGVILVDPPATHDVPGQPDGTGPCYELLGVLRVTDLPQVAGLLWPRHLVFVGGRPDAYRWAEALYERLGPPGAWWNVPELRHWRPASA